jgi:protein-disulfide isomerase
LRSGEALRDRLTMARRSPAPSAAPPASRRALQIALALSVAGIAVALWLARLHVRAHAGFTSACAINDTFNCDRVATSEYSVVLGIPVAIWGILGLAVAAALAAMGLARRKPHPAWPAGLLVVVAAMAVAASVALAIVSEFLIGSFCVVCAASWTIAVLLLVAAWRAARTAGVGAALRADLGVLRAHPGRTAGLAVAGLAALAIVAAAYPRYWDKPAEPPRQAAGGTANASAKAAATPASSPGETVVVEFSDYLCPFCAEAHADVQRRVAGRTDVKIVHRHFPLDPACNPLVKRAIHPGACGLAKAGICGEAQGRAKELDALIFANQRAKRPVAELAREAGLDVALFEECLAAPATDRRLASDVQSGIQAGVRATPTYVADGVVYSGGLPPVLASAPGSGR